jgi:hypothetical protein
MTLGQLIARTYYYLKDLNCVYFACQGLPHGIEDKMLFIENEPSKALQNSYVTVFSLSLLEDISCQKIKSNCWT